MEQLVLGETVRQLASEGFSMVRVDFYNIHGQIYFGEMTFTLDDGFATFSPDNLGEQMGNWIHLPIEKC